MKSIYYLSFFLLMPFIFVNCAGIKILDKNNEKTNLKVHLPKPYMLVEYNPAKDVEIKTSFIYLPDLENPLFLKNKNGIGSSSMEFSIANGQLSSFGATTDSKIPETITAIGSLSGLADLLPLEGTSGLESASTSDLKNVDKILVSVQKQFVNIDNTYNNLNLNETQSQSKIAIKALLVNARKISKDKSLSRVKELKKNIKDIQIFIDIMKFTAASDDTMKKFNQDFEETKAQLNNTLKFLPEKTNSESTFKLYSITSIKDTLRFDKVKIPNIK